MASSEVDQKFLGRLAKAVEFDDPLLAAILYKILGLSINLSRELVTARKNRKLVTAGATPPYNLYYHIIWLAREGWVMLEQWVLPMVRSYVELKVLAFKLRASFYHIFVLFHNNPPIEDFGYYTPEIGSINTPDQDFSRLDKGKGVAGAGAGIDHSNPQQKTQQRSDRTYEGGPVGPPPGLRPDSSAASFLMASRDYLPEAHQYFQEALDLADRSLWGSHSLRLSVKTEYSAFLFECMRDPEASRRMAKETISEVYNATEGIDNDMFNDACELVTVLGKMMKRGLGSGSGGGGGGGNASRSGSGGNNDNNSNNNNKGSKGGSSTTEAPTMIREERRDSPARSQAGNSRSNTPLDMIGPPGPATRTRTTTAAAAATTSAAMTAAPQSIATADRPGFI